jgi:hypothetical protein
VILTLNPSSIESYRTFLRVKQLPVYSITGRIAEFPDEYAARLGLEPEAQRKRLYKPAEKLFDYQRAIAEIAIRKQKYAVFADLGSAKRSSCRSSPVTF